jgi:hypothetical protein
MGIMKKYHKETPNGPRPTPQIPTPQQFLNQDINDARAGISNPMEPFRPVRDVIPVQPLRPFASADSMRSTTPIQKYGASDQYPASKQPSLPPASDNYMDMSSGFTPNTSEDPFAPSSNSTSSSEFSTTGEKFCIQCGAKLIDGKCLFCDKGGF